MANQRTASAIKEDLGIYKNSRSHIIKKIINVLFGTDTIFSAAGRNHGAIRNFYNFKTVHLYASLRERIFNTLSFEFMPISVNFFIQISQ